MRDCTADDAAFAARHCRRNTTAGEQGFDEGADIAFEDATKAAAALHFAEVQPHFARDAADGRAGVRGGKARFVDLRVGTGCSGGNRRRCWGCLRCRRRSGFRRFCRRCGCCCGRRGSGAAQGRNQVALFDFVADFDGDAGDGSRRFCRDFH